MIEDLKAGSAQWRRGRQNGNEAYYEDPAVHMSICSYGPASGNSSTETTDSSTEDPDKTQEVEKPKEPTSPYSSYSGYGGSIGGSNFPEVK